MDPLIKSQLLYQLSYAPNLERRQRWGIKVGGRTRTRTLDPLIKSQLLYQLSYAPNLDIRRSGHFWEWWAHKDSNLGPAD